MQLVRLIYSKWVELRERLMKIVIQPRNLQTDYQQLHCVLAKQFCYSNSVLSSCRFVQQLYPGLYTR